MPAIQAGGNKQKGGTPELAVQPGQSSGQGQSP